MIDEKKLVLQAIGESTNNGSIILKKNYREGLKHLDHFSHAIIIFSIAGNTSKRSLQESIVSIKMIDHSKGEILCSPSFIDDGIHIVYDIKPYFPCEDRVKESTNGHNISNSFATNYQNEIKVIGKIARENGRFKLTVRDLHMVKTVKDCSHIKIFWWFSRFDKPEYRKVLQCNPPYENAPRSGIFSSRSPVRPNPIAMTTARIINIIDNDIYVTELDCFEGTPLIGILPYNHATDYIENVRVPKWLSHWQQYVNDSDYKSGDIHIIKSPLENRGVPNSVKRDFTEPLDTVGEKLEGLTLKGARQNNLQGIDVIIPYNKITAITGVSGSGKSSLAFDIIYNECKQRFLDISGESFSVNKPDFDSLEGALPVVAVSQRSIGRNPRSTVGTITGISDYLRALFASIGVRHCPDCGNAVIPMTRDEIIAYISLFDEVCIKDIHGLRGESLDKALMVGDGACYISIDNREDILFQTHTSCAHCGKIMFDLTPSSFSSINPESMCPVCHGYGENLDIDVDLIITNPHISILDGASPIWGKLRAFQHNPNHNWMKGEIIALALDMNVNLEDPWCELPEEFRKQALYGSGSRKVTLKFENAKNGRNGDISRPVEGAYNTIKRHYAEKKSDRIAENFMKHIVCDYCNGERLNREFRMVTIIDKRFPEILSMPLSELENWCLNLSSRLSEKECNVALPLLKALYNNIESCLELGIGYLQLNRSSTTLSGGELQRLKLVCLVQSKISGVLYILDEPTAGLHPKDYSKLIHAIKRLQGKGNTLILVEHNRDLMYLADNLIDIGPKAGNNGGKLVACGTPAQIMNEPNSITGKYLSGERQIKIPSRVSQNSNNVDIIGAKYNNLKNISITFPRGAITCITGISGSGKSSLMKGVLYPSAIHNKPVNCENSINAKFSKVVMADQSPIGRSPRSVPATYMGIMDIVRQVFERASNLTSSHFSFNSPLGQCENCNGDGEIKADYIADLFVRCPVCEGKRYKKSILEIFYKGKNIFDVLEMMVEEAKVFFIDVPKLSLLLSSLCEVGLGYLKLGQNSKTLSGGEAQRLKLAKNLTEISKQDILYILDEPTTGLHFSDIQSLLLLLRRLSDNGNTVVMVEHNMEVVNNVDWIVDLGPESGDKGGYLVAQGRPSDIRNVENSYTGQSLKQLKI